MLLRVRGVVVTLVIVLTGLAAGTAAAALNPGVYVTRVKGATPAALNGTWRISFAAGQYEITRNGQVAVDGASTIRGQQVVFKDRFGPFRCLGSQATGTYHWSLAGTKLTFSVVHDPCPGRNAVLARVFTKTA